MPAAIEVVLAPEDEKQLLRFLEPYALTAYPDRIPPDFQPFAVAAENHALLTEPGYYFAGEQWGAVSVRTIRKGVDRGFQEIDETNSPVIHFDRSLMDETGQLRSGKLWTEINVVGDMQRNPAFPEPYRRMWLALRDYLVNKCHKSEPSGFFIGAQAARMSKAGTPLRVQGRKGWLLTPYR